MGLLKKILPRSIPVCANKCKKFLIDFCSFAVVGATASCTFYGPSRAWQLKS